VTVHATIRKVTKKPVAVHATILASHETVAE
jgi:hypothetical protein